MKNVLISNVCRVNLSPQVLALAEAGVVTIPQELLAPRQLKVAKGRKSLDATLKEHRGSMIATVSPEVAEKVVEEGMGNYEPQSLLSYTKEEYLADPEVVANEEEHSRVSESDAELVVVAVIGNNRSPLAVVRNIVSGCQNLDNLQEDAQGALDSANIVLIE